jgi:hypothetical protein
VWNEERLWGNLLSSQAATLNLLAPLALDLTLASRVWRLLLPEFVHQVTGFRFEHSPGRFGDQYFGDGTAFDAVIDCVTPASEAAVITIEFKLIEDMVGPAATHRSRYDETAADSGLFIDPRRPILRRPGFEQLKREHVMTHLMLKHGLATRGRCVLLTPALNRRAQAVAKLYAAELVEPTGDSASDHVGFVNLTIEQVSPPSRVPVAPPIARPFFERYLDLHRVARCASGLRKPATHPTHHLGRAQPAWSPAGKRHIHRGTAPPPSCSAPNYSAPPTDCTTQAHHLFVSICRGGSLMRAPLLITAPNARSSSPTAFVPPVAKT